MRDNQEWSNCQHLKFWWAGKDIPVPWYTSVNKQFTPLSIMGQAIPNDENSFNEFQLLHRDVNSAKQAYVDPYILLGAIEWNQDPLLTVFPLSSRAWSFRTKNYIRDYQDCIKKERWAEAMNKVRLVIWTLKYVSILYNCSIFAQVFLALLLVIAH